MCLCVLVWQFYYFSMKSTLVEQELVYVLWGRNPGMKRLCCCPPHAISVFLLIPQTKIGDYLPFGVTFMGSWGSRLTVPCLTWRWLPGSSTPRWQRFHAEACAFVEPLLAIPGSLRKQAGDGVHQLTSRLPSVLDPALCCANAPSVVISTVVDSFYSKTWYCLCVSRFIYLPFLPPWWPLSALMAAIVVCDF